MDRGHLPEGWEIKKLGDLCEFKNGLWTGKKPPYQNIGVIRNTNFTKDGYLDDSNIAFLDVEVSQYKTRKLLFGDIILEKSGGGPKQPVGRVIVFTKTNGDFSFSNFTSVIRISDKNKLNYSYLHKLLYFFYISGFTESIQTHSTGIRNLQLKDYKEFLIPVPSLDEQKKIVAILDEVFEGIDQAIRNTEKNLANAHELFESYLNKIFTQKGDGWIEKTLGEVCDFLNGFAFKSDDVVKDSDVQLIRMGNLYQNILDIERNPVFYPDEFKEKFSRYVLLEGDLIMSLTGTVDKEDYGYTVEVPEIEKTLLLNQRIAKFINIDSDYVDKNFFLYLLRSNSFLSALYKSSRGVRQANLSSSSMKKLTISLPPLDSQKSLVFIFRRLENETQKLETIYRQKLAALNELKQSILQKAFTGQLTLKSL
jgi:type I restriction enzyme S subunit